jgi:Zn-finger nucleic acid-binding protein
MTCPKCQGQMRQYERNGVTIDQCTECRGIFLDRGELERLIDGEAAYHAAPPSGPPVREYGSRPAAGYRDYDSDEYPTYGHGHGQGQGRPRKRRSFLGELFD